MFTARYYGDRVEEVPAGRGEVSGKLEAIRKEAIEKQNLVLSEGNFIPPRVLGSMIMRRRTLWGRYE